MVLEILLLLLKFMYLPQISCTYVPYSGLFVVKYNKWGDNL